MPALKFIIQGLVAFFFVVQRSVVGYDCRDPFIGHGGCRVISPLSSNIQRPIDHHDFAQFVVACAFHPAAAYLAYRCSAEIYRSSVCSSDCWFPYTLADGQIHRMPGPEVMLHKRTDSG